MKDDQCLHLVFPDNVAICRLQRYVSYGLCLHKELQQITTRF